MLHTINTKRQKAAAVAASNLERHQKMASTEYDWNKLPKKSKFLNKFGDFHAMCVVQGA